MVKNFKELKVWSKTSPLLEERRINTSPLLEKERVRASEAALVAKRSGVRILLLLTFLTTYHLPLTTFVHAASGSTSANYLKVDVGARAVAMAGVQFGAEKDSFAPFYNPAFLSNLTQKEIGFMHNEFFQDFRQELFSYAHPTDLYGTFGTAMNYFSYGKVAGFSEDGRPTGNLSADDTLLDFSWGKDWMLAPDSFATGASLKFFRKTLATKSAMAYAMDLGFSYQVPLERLSGLRLAASFQNLGTGFKFDQEVSPLPRTIRAGAAYSFLGSAFTVAFDGVSSESGLSALYPAVGIEYRLLKILSIRLGYKGNKSLDKNLTYGVGFENPRFSLDYAFIPFGDLGDTHRISARYRFGKTHGQPQAEKQLQEKLNYAKTLYAQGELVEAYIAATQIQLVAPFLKENEKLLTRIRKEFREVEDSHKKAELIAQVDALFTKGERFFEEGNLINARLEFKAVLGLQPENKPAQGYLKRIEGQFESFVQNFYQNGMVAFAAENYERAKEEFEKVLTIKPDHEQAKAQIARCIEILEKKQKEVAATLQKDVISKAFRDALTAYRKEELEKAIALFREVLQLDPRNEEAQRYISLSRETLYKRYLEKGQEFANKGEWESAIRNLKNAADFYPSSKEAKSLLEDVQRRWDLQKKVLSQNLYKEGLEHFLSGDKKQARTIWQKAVDLDPENEEARRGLSRIAP